MSTEVRKAEFHFDSHPDTTFPGYTKGDTWNGWACPYFERKVAEEIVDMKIANGATEPSNFLQERDRLVESDKDLRKTKTAMKEAGPGFTEDRSLVEDVDDGPEKEASADQTPSSSEYAADAVRELRKRASSMGAA